MSSDRSESTQYVAVIARRLRAYGGAGSAYALTSGRIYDGQAPQDTEMADIVPFIVVNDIGGPIDRMFDGGTIESARLQITVVDAYDGNRRRCGQVWDAIVAVLEGATLTMEDGTFIRVDRISRPTTEIDGDYVTMAGEWALDVQFDRY